jgi:hypothetical protein
MDIVSRLPKLSQLTGFLTTNTMLKTYVNVVFLDVYFADAEIFRGSSQG